MFERINILKELEKEKIKAAEAHLLARAEWILQQARREDESIQAKSGSHREENDLHHYFTPGQDRVFLEKEIKRVCIRYRLRFLSSSLFKGKIPYETYIAIKEQEKKHHVRFKNFMILAPAEAFRLKDATEDPLLFACLGNGRYYLIHQWGNDLSWYKKCLYLPFRNIFTLASFSVVLALVFTLLLPESAVPESHQITAPMTMLYKTFCFFILSGMVFTLSLIFGIVTAKDFSENVWQSRYFN